MQIGPIQLDNKTILAPLAGITNLPFRVLAREAGAAMVCSEMISANGLVFGSGKTLRMLQSAPEERPLSIQIFGSDPSVMAEAAVMVQEAGADVLDINFGCAVRKVVKTGAGAALMQTPERAAAILASVRRAVHIPLTIKIRTGWVRDGSQALAIARMAQDAGVDAVALHPRTAAQGFAGRADWSMIRSLKQVLRIPVIGNGDILQPEDGVRMLAETGCDAVMIGRCAIGCPWIFGQINALLAGRPVVQPGLEQRRRQMLRYLDASVRHIGEAHACRMMRGRLGWFVKGLSHGTRFKEAVKGIETRDQAAELIHRFFGGLS